MVAIAWLSSRILVWAFVMVGHLRLQTMPPPSDKEGAWIGVSSFWLNPWTTFDSRYLIQIAQSGYTGTRDAAFFPLFPLILRALGGSGADSNTMAVLGIIVSNLAFLGALWLLFVMTRDEWGEKVAKRAVWIEAFFPAAAFSAAVYTESLFLLLSIGFFYAARRQRWWLSAPLGFMAGLTRNSGHILCLALLLDRPKAPLTRADGRARALCALCPLLALVMVQLFLQKQVGGSSLSVQKEFGRALTFPLLPIWLDLRHLVVVPSTWSDFVTAPMVMSCLITFILLWIYRSRFSMGKLLFIGLVLLSNLTLSWQSEPHTNSTLRFLLGTFPAAQLFALVSVEKLPSRRATMYLAAAGFALFFLQSYLFGLKDFLG
ncbi:hypothetical protein IAD21_05178 [Abditibacteriota bacterium]|nr:hypothetical protein IAD21_05178 [Abditibacteriota bacterium]